MTRTSGTAGATPARTTHFVIPSAAEVALALSGAAANGLRLANRELLDAWFGHLRHAGGTRGRRPAPRSAEESFRLQAEYVRAALEAHVALWARLPAALPSLPAPEAGRPEPRRAA
jgi:hypothetical protein